MLLDRPDLNRLVREPLVLNAAIIGVAMTFVVSIVVLRDIPSGFGTSPLLGGTLGVLAATFAVYSAVYTHDRAVRDWFSASLICGAAALFLAYLVDLQMQFVLGTPDFSSTTWSAEVMGAQTASMLVGAASTLFGFVVLQAQSLDRAAALEVLPPAPRGPMAHKVPHSATVVLGVRAVRCKPRTAYPVESA